jgi:L-fuconolactonase
VSVIDSHAHVAPHWYEPVEALRGQMDRTGVDGAVLVQMLGQTDNAYIQSCRRREPHRFSTVVLVDVENPDAAGEVARLAADGAAGLRLRPTARSPRGDALGIWRAALAAGLAISSPGSSTDFASPSFAELVAALPDLPIVLEHLGSTSTPDRDDEQRALRRTTFALARYPNVFIKVPGLGEFAERAKPPGDFPFARPLPPYLDEVFTAFGPARMMWGSDFPVVSSREGYANALTLCRDALAACSATERAAIFGGTAARVFSTRP